MQMTRTLAVLALSCLTDAVNLRKGGVNQPRLANMLAMKVCDDVDYKVVNKSSIEKKDSVDCLCKLGSFWHWRIKACVKQGGWGYECGYFPKEHHHRVCQDGLKCEILDQTRVKYVHPGAVPASCKPCLKEDNCTKGKERHSADCLKEYKVTGSACQTVQVSVMATASAKVTEEVTTSGTASATAKATATEKATVKKDGQKASATKKAAAEGEATAKSEGTGKATAEATATEKGTAIGKGCITVQEVKKLLDLQNKSMGAVLSAQVVARGDKEAFDRAYAKALAAAQKAGLLNAEQAAEALASAEAREQAALEAVANANEAAAWKAEAGAKKDAQDKAKATAMGEAQAAAGKEATAAAKAAAKAAADAKAAQEALKAAKAGNGDAASKAAAQAKANAAARKATQAANAAAAAKAKEDAIAKAAAAEAAAAAQAKKQRDALKAQQDALSDVVNGPPGPDGQSPPAKPTEPTPTNPPRKISKDQLEAKLP